MNRKELADKLLSLKISISFAEMAIATNHNVEFYTANLEQNKTELLKLLHDKVYVIFDALLQTENHTDMIDMVKELLIDGCEIDGGHHKQWYLNEALKNLIGETNYTELVHEKQQPFFDEDGEEYNGEWDEGIAP